MITSNMFTRIVPVIVLVIIILLLVLVLVMPVPAHLLHRRTIPMTIPTAPKVRIRALHIRTLARIDIQLFRILSSGSRAFATDAAAPDNETDDDEDECETADEDVRPTGEDLFFVHFLLFGRGDRGVFHLVGGEEGVGGVAGRVDAAHAHLDEIIVRGLFVGEGEELNKRIVTVVLGMGDPIAVVHERVGVTHYFSI